MYTNTQLSFHETFQPQAEYISAILELAGRGFVGTKEDISTQTGIPTGKQKGKVVPHLKYAQYMNLIKYRADNNVFSLSPSPMGARILVEDRYILEELTKIACHFYLTSTWTGAPQWTYVFNGFTHLFDQRIDFDHLKDRCNEYFGFPIELGIVKNSYLNGMFEGLSFVDWDDHSICFHSQCVSRQYLHLYAYTLLDCWEFAYPKARELSLPDIVTKIGWGTSFGFDMETVSLVMDILSDEGYVQVNRQLYPVTVIRIQTSDCALLRMYSNLI